jgi:hypothetical protein
MRLAIEMRVAEGGKPHPMGLLEDLFAALEAEI